ncbi:Uncharacterized protein TCM_000001 [Theobroma cacao]|uniref:DUF4283 domain-containing protein n=1 Tax=Theobroma cacao TaxID=3641 RepID=A0A061DKJ2_THECC|nr:Uncharacterized protein TCM_000001 [Theobroma cacao]
MSLMGKFSHMPKLQEVRIAFKKIDLTRAYEVRWLDYNHVLIHLSNEQDFNRIWIKQVWFIANQKIRVFKWTLEFESDKESTVVCVEHDYRKPPVDQVWIVVKNKETEIDCIVLGNKARPPGTTKSQPIRVVEKTTRYGRGSSKNPMPLSNRPEDGGRSAGFEDGGGSEEANSNGIKVTIGRDVEVQNSRKMTRPPSNNFETLEEGEDVEPEMNAKQGRTGHVNSAMPFQKIVAATEQVSPAHVTVGHLS